MRREEGRGVYPPWCLKRFLLGDEGRALDGENLKRARGEGDLDGGRERSEPKERRDPERRWRWRSRDDERRGRWRTGIHGLERFVLTDKGWISRDIDKMYRLGV
ncbi:hypothetical protein TNCV_131741 [Trichonephila clavipes]|nr:hypothetical protein TNCV_131741 [Trichonephila clavipes]